MKSLYCDKPSANAEQVTTTANKLQHSKNQLDLLDAVKFDFMGLSLPTRDRFAGRSRIELKLAYKIILLSRHRDAHYIAPLAGALVGLDVDALVFPERALAGGRHGGGVGVIGQWLKKLLQPSDETMQRLMEVLQ